MALRHALVLTLFAAFVQIAVVKPAVAQEVRFGNAEYERHSSAAFFYSNSPGGLVVHGQIEITYGSPTWKPAFGEALAAAKPGERLRLGNNFWSTLDVSCPLAHGDGQQVEPGFYYLALEKQVEGGLGLVLLDPRPIREAKQNANQSSEIRGGVVLPLARRALETRVEKLSIVFAPGDSTTTARLVLRFGDVELSAALPMSSDG